MEQIPYPSIRRWKQICFSVITSIQDKVNIKIEMFCGTDNAKHTQQLPQDAKKIENYYYGLSDKVGAGNFSQVFKGVDRNTGTSVAVKVIKYASLTSKVAQQLLKNQIAILKQLDHPNVIKCYDVFASKNNCYIVTDFYQGGDMERIIFKNKYFQERDIAKIVYEVYKGLLYLNERNIIHRDFKPANIFLDGAGTPKIADFGFAVKSAEPFKDISIGSPIYMSPEGLILHEYGPKTQVWAFGIMIYEMLHGETPLSKCKDEKELREKVLLPPVYRQGISHELRKMLDLCLTVDPKHRIQMKAIANTAYMNRIIRQFQSKSKDLTDTNHTNSTVTKNALQFVKQVKTYEQALALLQYCRLVHKTTQQTPSPILSQWLLNMCWNLLSIHFSAGDRERNDNLMSTINNYYSKYHRQHADNKVDVSSEDVIVECQKMLARVQGMGVNCSLGKLRQNNLVMLLRETEMLHKYGEGGKISLYAKATQVEKYLQAQKSGGKIASNQFIFNK